MFGLPQRIPVVLSSGTYTTFLFHKTAALFAGWCLGCSTLVCPEHDVQRYTCKNNASDNHRLHGAQYGIQQWWLCTPGEGWCKFTDGGSPNQPVILQGGVVLSWCNVYQPYCQF